MNLTPILRRWLRKILNSDMVEATDSPVPLGSIGGGNPFNKEYEGWNFRIHRAVGGHIVEAWCYEVGPPSNSYAKSVSSSNRSEHKLFIVTNDEELGVELPNILTQLALERP